MTMPASVALVAVACALAGQAAAQEAKPGVPDIALSCLMESPDEYRNHVVSIGIDEKRKSATVQGRRAREVQIEYLRFVVIEEKVRWTIDRGTGRISMFTTSGDIPVLYGNGACERVTKRKF